MTPLPQILIIDDTLSDNNDERRDICRSFGLLDRESGGGSGVGDFLGEVTFESGQSENEGILENEIGKVMARVQTGWPFSDGSRWALVCVDLYFNTGPKTRPKAVPFGAQIIKECESRWPFPGLSRIKPHQTAIPIVMLSSESPSVVEDLIGPDTNVETLSKWDGG